LRCSADSPGRVADNLVRARSHWAVLQMQEKPFTHRFRRASGNRQNQPGAFSRNTPQGNLDQNRFHRKTLYRVDGMKAGHVRIFCFLYAGGRQSATGKYCYCRFRQFHSGDAKCMAGCRYAKELGSCRDRGRLFRQNRSIGGGWKAARVISRGTKCRPGRKSSIANTLTGKQEAL
jgi:hypothetical protein